VTRVRDIRRWFQTTMAGARRVAVFGAICAVLTACGTSEPTTASARDGQTATTDVPAADGCERWLRDDVVAPELAAAADAVRAKLDRDLPLMDHYVLIDHATPPRIRVQVTDHRDEIEAAARAVLDPRLASRLMVELVRADPLSSTNQLFAQVGEFLKTSPAPRSEIGMVSLSLEIMIELNLETHACELADAIAQRFPADPVFVKVWPPASLADEGKDFFGAWYLSDAAVSLDDRLQLELKTDGTFQMRDRCNYKTGRWRIERNAAKTLMFTDVAITAMACPSRPDILDIPRRAQINTRGDLLIEQTTGSPLTYTR
jgi:hypothetical protein